MKQNMTALLLALALCLGLTSAAHRRRGSGQTGQDGSGQPADNSAAGEASPFPLP